MKPSKGFFFSNTVVPDVWIIEEELRRERERQKQRKERLPLEMPSKLPLTEEPQKKNQPKKDTEERGVVVIDL